jgi:hypothetical protein
MTVRAEWKEEVVADRRIAADLGSLNDALAHLQHS